MPNYDPRVIANEFIRLNGGPMPQMKLQKLVYLAHGWNLAINNEPLVTGRIEAWDGGPVMRVIWDHLRDFGYNALGSLLGQSQDKPYTAELLDRERQIIHHVWLRYGAYSGTRLSEMTHEPGTPWSNAYFGGGRNSVLSASDIRQHFIELALAGRQRQA